MAADNSLNGVRIFRWIVFLLAAFYVVYYYLLVGDYSHVGGPFRFLTFWALLLSFASASRMLAMTEGRTQRDWGALVGLTAATNAVVVLMYWRLYFEDPSSVNAGEPGAWWEEYYLHLAGPLLQWIDAIFIYGAFRHWRGAIAGLVALIAAYIAWIELVVGPMNDFPVGSVTSGLPYPFLNSMDFDARTGFYATTFVTTFVLFLIFWALAATVRQVRARRGQSSASSAANPVR